MVVPFANPEDPTYDECRALGRYPWLIMPGKQCPHPSNTWFRDPRPSPRPLAPPRKAILEHLFRTHAIFSPRHQAILDHYKEPPPPPPPPSTLASASLNHDVKVDEDGPNEFHLFPFLPIELREQIWMHAIPRRTLDVREVFRQGQYVGIRSVRLPVPTIASVCREARELVMRLGCRLALDDGRSVVAPAGFVMKESDVLLWLPDYYLSRPDERPEPDPPAAVASRKKDSGRAEKQNELERDGVVVVGMRDFHEVMRCEAVAVNWPWLRRQQKFALTGKHRDPPTEISAYSLNANREVGLNSWSALKSANLKWLKTVYVFFRSRYIEVSLLLGKEFTDQQHAGDMNNLQTEVQELVDLYDDARLAELSSLETLHVGKRTESDKPRYMAPEARNAGLCLNCERVQWERYYKPLVALQWLELFRDELDDEQFAAAFAIGTGLQYDVENEWVKEKLRDMPEFRPAILVHIQAAEEALLREEEDNME